VHNPFRQIPAGGWRANRQHSVVTDTEALLVGDRLPHCGDLNILGRSQVTSMSLLENSLPHQIYFAQPRKAT
jgi:hypothetical protein